MDLVHIAKEMNYVSEKLVSMGLVHLMGGNFSVRDGNQMAITGHRSAKRSLTADDLYVVGVDTDDELEGISKTLGIHREILRKTRTTAVVHAHPYYATLLSYFTDEICPIDENGIFYLGTKVHCVASEGFMKWALLDNDLAEMLTTCPAAILKWHGSFTIGDSLEEAFNMTQALEISCRLVVDTFRLRSSLGNATLPKYASPNEDLALT